MKTAEDYIRQINDRLMPHPHRLSRKQREGVKSLIMEIQREACEYEKDYLTGEIDEQSILKLKK
jgi:hypothetical protein